MTRVELQNVREWRSTSNIALAISAFLTVTGVALHSARVLAGAVSK